jgi:hypothetical protein
MNTGKILIVAGILILLVGVIVYFFHNKLGWIGNLPGDIRIERENVKIYFPLATMILVSVLITLVLQIWKWLQ